MLTDVSSNKDYTKECALCGSSNIEKGVKTINDDYMSGEIEMYCYHCKRDYIQVFGPIGFRLPRMHI